MTDPALSLDDVRWGPDGLVPAVVRDPRDGAVLMLAWMDREALAATLASGEVHFHSRSRGRLWRKGESSGNVLRLRAIALDCDADALLVTADPAGPVCHRGTRTCWDPDSGSEVAGGADPTATTSGQGFDWLEKLWATIEARASADPATSYTARLIGGGVDASARKVAEEATEVVMAAKDDASASPTARSETRRLLANETADLLYHALVLLRERGLAPAEVIETLRERHRR